MDCTLNQSLLIGYHFATVTDGERSEVEKHLVDCQSCLRTYLALKAHVDRGTSDDDAPSDGARARLRAAVEARFRPTPAWRLRRWLTRPVPLYQGLAVAALLLLAAALGPAVIRAVHPGSSTHFAERVDSARPTAESLTIY
ncbi:MAG: anti-sigma factor family protein [Polyangiaceae bacterium]